MTLYLAELVAYDPALGTTRTLRFASGNGYTTKSTDTPGNTYYAPVVVDQAVDISRAIFSGSTQGEAQIGLGDLVLLNGDGALDYIQELGLDGRVLTIRATDVNPLTASYPSDFTTRFVGTMRVPEFTHDAVTVKVRDRLSELNLPLQTTKYAGSNVLPAGLEGVASDLKGKPKPVCYGSASNIPAPCVNTDKLIYQVNDGTISSVDAVYDKGRALFSGFRVTTALSLPGGRGTNATVFANSTFMLGTDRASNPALACLVYTSPDGVTWTQRTSPFGVGITLNALAYGNGMWLAVSLAGLVATSVDDGVTWTAGTSVPLGAGRNVRAAAFGAGLFVVGDGNNGTNASASIYTTTNGAAWTTRTTPFTYVDDSVASVIYGSSAVGFVMTTITMQIATSADGATWALQATAPSQPYSIAYGNGVYYIGLAGGTCLTSRDGVAWVPRTTGMTVVVYGVAWGDGVTIAVGLRGDNGVALVVSLDDGVTWERGFDVAGYGAAFGAHRFLIIGAFTVGVTTTAAAYASQADLLDDTLAPAPGTFKYYSSSSGSYFRLGSPPAGLITADVTQGANAAARTTGQLWGTVLTRAGKSSGTDYSSSDITTLDGLNSAVVGYWTMDENVTYLDVLNALASSVGAWWGPDKSGVYRIKQFAAPSGSSVLTIGTNQPVDLLKPLEGIATNDPGEGLPVYRCTVQWGRIYAVQATDLAGGVTDARRAVVAQEWRNAKAEDTSILTSHLLSPETIESSLLTTETDAQAEATRRLTLRSVARQRYEAVVPLTAETAVIDLGDVVTLANPRYGLSVVGDSASGALMRVLGVAPNTKAGELTLTLWGRSTNTNVIGSDGTYLIGSNGAYVIGQRAA